MSELDAVPGTVMGTISNTVPRWVRPARLALVLPVVPLLAATAVLSLMPGGQPSQVLGVPSTVLFMLVGWVILRGHPRNTVAWSFLVAALLLSLESFGAAGVVVAGSRGWTSPFVHVFGWATGATWFPGLFVLITVALLHFPDGRPLSPRWRWATGAAIALMTLYFVCFSIVTWQVPLAQLNSDDLPTAPGWRGVVLTAGIACLPLMAPVVVAAVVALVLRWRRSDAVGRLQIRWVAAAGLVTVLVEAGVDLYGTFVGPMPDGVQTVLESVAFGLIAVATGVAITRHGLYEIDRIVSRAVAYLLISALLVAVYAGVVTGAGLVIPDRFGSIGVAVATLVAVALFVPLRTRVQHAVDARFDRARYDADRLVTQFAARTRGELSQTGLHDELLRTVRLAVAPASATIWVLPGHAGVLTPSSGDAPVGNDVTRG